MRPDRDAATHLAPVEDHLAPRILACALRTLALLVEGRLHRSTARVGSSARLPDGRPFVIFRETTCDRPAPGEDVILAVWFRLRGVPAGARVRRWLFERESILNTLLYAGNPGYATKLWMVDPETSDYAGLYQWQGRQAAERYARYITAILRPLSVPGSVGYEAVIGGRLEDYAAP